LAPKHLLEFLFGQANLLSIQSLQNNNLSLGD
jgi:hypothetical protein